MKKKGSDGGHNGLKNIIEALGSSEFCRLRIGIGNDFAKGKQIDYVIGEWKQSEIDEIQPRLDVAVEMIKSFVAIGPDLTMNQYNNK